MLKQRCRCPRILAALMVLCFAQTLMPTTEEGEKEQEPIELISAVSHLNKLYQPKNNSIEYEPYLSLGELFPKPLSNPSFIHLSFAVALKPTVWKLSSTRLQLLFASLRPRGSVLLKENSSPPEHPVPCCWLVATDVGLVLLLNFRFI